MWFTGKNDLAIFKDALFSELMSEVKSAAPGARLTYSLRTHLEKFSPSERREIACRMREGCAPLFIACKRGHVEIVEYLLTVCNADIEQRGLYEVPDDRSVHNVTPLWCAAVSGKAAVIRCLVHYGADVNAVSDTGSTPVRSACFMTHLDIVSYLVECGADILRPNYNGGTCLINSVQSVQLCLYLLEHGAKVNAKDIQNKTALHYAIQEHRFETTKLLLEHGADPHNKSRPVALFTLIYLNYREHFIEMLWFGLGGFNCQRCYKQLTTSIFLILVSILLSWPLLMTYHLFFN